MKSLKTPLRYPGGKSRAVKYLLPKFPGDITEYREPFLGGGSVAIAFTKEYPDIPVWVNDLYNPLYTFWCILRDRPDELYEILKDAKENLGEVPVKIKFTKEENTEYQKRLEKDSKNTRKLVDYYDKEELEKVYTYFAKGQKFFDEMTVQLNHKETEDIHRAAAFYVINKCSFSGMTQSSSYSGQAVISNFSMSNIEKLPEFSKLIQHWKITNLSYCDMMFDKPPVNTFWFLDPPYDIKDNLYGNKGALHKGFNHQEFHSYMTQGNIQDKWMITYNSNPILREWYTDYIQSSWDLTYTMRSVGDYMNEQKDRAELLITNYANTKPIRISDFCQSDEEEYNN